MKIVCLTSNGYVNCLAPFSFYWNHFAGTLRRVTVACYDAPVPELPDNFDVVSIGKQEDYTWSAGLRRLVELADDPLLLILLEDYFLTEPVKWETVERLQTLMERNRKIAKFDLTDDRLKVTHHHDRAQPDLLISDWDAPFQMSFQAAIWRSDFLYRWLDPAENAWQAEKNGTKRLIQARQPGACDEMIAGCRFPPMHYANAIGGEGHKPGVIEAKHMPDWMFAECVERGWANG